MELLAIVGFPRTPRSSGGVVGVLGLPRIPRRTNSSKNSNGRWRRIHRVGPAGVPRAPRNLFGVVGIPITPRSSGGVVGILGVPRAPRISNYSKRPNGRWRPLPGPSGRACWYPKSPKESRWNSLALLELQERQGIPVELLVYLGVPSTPGIRTDPRIPTIRLSA